MAEWISLWSLGPDATAADVASVGPSGFEGVEVWAEHAASDQHLQWAVDAGLKVGMHLPFHDLNLATPDPVVADRAMQVLCGCLGRLATVGGRHAVLHGGYAWTVADRSQALQRVEDRLAELGGYAERLGVRLLLENLWPDRLGYTHPVASDLDEWCALLDAASVGACLDIGHLAAGGPGLAVALRRLGPRLQSIHYSDNHRQADEHLWPGDGEGVTEGFWEAVAVVGYAGPVVYEINPSVYDTEILRAHSRGGLRR